MDPAVITIVVVVCVVLFMVALACYGPVCGLDRERLDKDEALEMV